MTTDVRPESTTGPNTGPDTVVPGRASVGAAVPWLTVLLLAAVMAYGDGFWVVSLRGAVGAIERTDSPFTSWLRESTLLLPLFAAAVVVALRVALRWFGPTPSGVKNVAVTALLVVAAGSVAGTAWLMSSSAYDYRLQSDQAASMSAMGHSCSAACLDSMQRATLDLQVRGVAAGAGLLLLANLVLVAWMVLLLGGRLRAGDVMTRPRRQVQSLGGLRKRLGGRRSPATRAADWRVLLVVALLGSSLIHVAVVPEHLEEWPSAGRFFVALAVLEVLLAVVVCLTAGVGAGDRWVRMTLRVAAGASVGTVALWAGSRSWGMPFGPEAGVPEPLGLADGAASVLELLTLLAAVLLLRRRTDTTRAPLRSHARALLVLSLVAVTCIGCGGSAVPGVHAFGVESGMASAGAPAPIGLPQGSALATTNGTS